MAVVQVHLAFLGGVSGWAVDNIRLFVDPLCGDRDVCPPPLEHLTL